MNMDRSTLERFLQRLKGGLVLLALVFGMLMMFGGPPASVAETEKATRTIVVDPINRSWDAY